MANAALPVDPKVELDEDRRKHLDYITATIIRMAACSFQLKGWSVTIVSAILAVTATTTGLNGVLPLLGLIPALIFWILDAYYLRQEKLYRKMYDDARMPNSTLPYYEMKTARYDGEVEGIVTVMRSKTEWPLHGILAATLIGVSVWAFWPQIKKQWISPAADAPQGANAVP